MSDQAKEASVPLPFPEREANKMDTAKFLTAVPLAALAIGALARGGMGMRDMFTAHKLPSRNLLGSTQYIGLPSMRREEEEAGQRLKLGEAGMVDQLVTGIAQPVYDTFFKSGPESNSWFGGDSAHSVAQVPASGFALPLGLAGLYGGWKGTDALLDSRRRQEQESELSRVRREYMTALQGKHAALDKLAEEKTAEITPPAPAMPNVPTKPGLVDSIPFGGQASGMYGTTAMAAALAAALASGKLSYDFFNSQSKRKTLDEALKRRSAQNSDVPAPVFAYTE